MITPQEAELIYSNQIPLAFDPKKPTTPISPKYLAIEVRKFNHLAIREIAEEINGYDGMDQLYDGRIVYVFERDKIRAAIGDVDKVLALDAALGINGHERQAKVRQL